MLVGPNMKYSEKVLIQVGSQIIDRILKQIITKDLENISETWKQSHMSTVLSKSTQLKEEGTFDTHSIQINYNEKSHNSSI